MRLQNMGQSTFSGYRNTDDTLEGRALSALFLRRLPPTSVIAVPRDLRLRFGTPMIRSAMNWAGVDGRVAAHTFFLCRNRPLGMRPHGVIDRRQPPLRPSYTDSVFKRLAMARLTLRIDDDLLQRAREAALRERTSVNTLVREYLERYVDARQRRFESLDVLDALAARSTSQRASAWTRDEVNTR